MTRARTLYDIVDKEERMTYLAQALIRKTAFESKSTVAPGIDAAELEEILSGDPEQGLSPEYKESQRKARIKRHKKRMVLMKGYAGSDRANKFIAENPTAYKGVSGNKTPAAASSKATPKSSLDPRVKKWMDERTGKGEKIRMGGKSILKMIKADAEVKRMGGEVTKWQKVIDDPRTTEAAKAAAQQKLEAAKKNIAPHEKIVKDFNTDRERRKQFNQTPESVKAGRQHMKGAVKASTDAWSGALQAAGYKGTMGEKVPKDVWDKAEVAASDAGSKYVKSRLGLFSDKDVANIQQYSRFRQAGGDSSPLQFKDPKFQQQVGTYGVNYGMQNQSPEAANMGFMDQVSKGFDMLKSGKTPQQLGYDAVVDKMSSGYLDRTKDMVGEYSQGRQDKIKKWAPWVIGGGALLTGALAGMHSGKDKAAPGEAKEKKVDNMAWTTDAFRNSARNKQSIATAAPKSPFGNQFRSFMSKNPFGRA